MRHKGYLARKNAPAHSDSAASNHETGLVRFLVHQWCVYSSPQFSFCILSRNAMNTSNYAFPIYLGPSPDRPSCSTSRFGGATEVLSPNFFDALFSLASDK